MQRNPRQSETQNMIIAMILSILVLLYWNYYIEAPRQKAESLAQKAKAEQQALLQHETPQQPGQQDTPTLKPRPELLTESPRLPIASESLHGSINLKGLRLDDLTLARYRETLDAQSPEVTLFSPSEDADGYFAGFGWVSQDKALKLPAEDSIWSADQPKLTPEAAVTLSWKNPDGVTFLAKIALDSKYLFTVTQSAIDASGRPITLQAYAYINRVFDIHDVKKHPILGIVHEGPLGVFDTTLKETQYKALTEEKEQVFEAGEGWLGMADKYWLSAIITPRQSFTAHFSFYNSRGRDHYQTDFLNSPAGETTLHLFAGVKEFALLEQYSKQYHIPLFTRAVDFGIFYWLAEPLFRLLTWFHALVGNFGIAILLLTVVVKVVMYPLARKSFIAMNQMKALQPRMKEIQERYKADKMQMNQAVMELYKREKVNPASGCLPIFIQIPVFISLYKVLYVTIEMRHAPFFGWVRDLSAPDPTNLFTFFGLIPWGAPTWLHLGIWPILMCLTMYVQQKQSPPPTDPTQASMMKYAPLFFLFLFHDVAAGLMIYWTWSNIISILQQWHIKRMHGDGRKPKKKT